MSLTWRATIMNLNECKFGDRLRTANGQMAIYLMHNLQDFHHCAVQDNLYGMETVTIVTYDDDGQQNTYFSEYDQYNIIGKQEE